MSEAIGGRIMFNPSEWIRHVRDINGHYTITYTNTHTQLEKMEVTFSHEQQALLQAEQVKLYRIGGTNSGD